MFCVVWGVHLGLHGVQVVSICQRVTVGSGMRMLNENGRDLLMQLKQG